ncbi:GNAT family N-acetyltransferase [Dictyobacter formicarum]|uniref:N-acetyltransferase n=1 Tax=Dictyobacter formicarum TaxID=2778368 RepID=A0ABQ3VU73_9CHLR|nr:GNAT family N-acetyltransferase [Dictyobacter formicarum]GHO89785.1 N-acetyltransferase [Dictyobacter formicarum]
MGINEITYTKADESEIEGVYKLVKSVFDQYVAPAYTDQGIQEFYKYIQLPAIKERLHRKYFILLAKVENEIVGVIEIRNYEHVSMLFVSSHYQRKGIANNLLKRAIKICKQYVPNLETISVHSSPNSVHIYKKLGFEKTAEEKETNGIKFTPMTLHLPQ